MKRKRNGLTRRRLLLSSGAAVAAASTAKMGEALASSGAGEETDERTEVVTISAVEADGELTLKRSDGSEFRLRDPNPVEDWRPGFEAPRLVEDWLPGHEAIVIERLGEDGQWFIHDIQRVYREIEPQSVQERHGSVLEVPNGQLVIDDQSHAQGSADGTYGAVPLDAIEPGTTVTGLGYRRADGDGMVVALLGSRTSD